MTHSYTYAEHDPGIAGAPTLILLHGTGGDENQFFGLGRQILPDARIVAPRGDVSEHGALRYFRRTGEGVYDMEDLSLRTAKMAEFITGLDASGPVFGLGYSNGANILASVMIAFPEIFARAVLMHPLIPWTPDPVPGLSGKDVLITAGRRDRICPANETRKLEDWFAAQGAMVSTFWHEGGHEIDEDELYAIAAFLKR